MTALNFPANPQDEDLYQGYQYVAAKDAWILLAGPSGAGVPTGSILMWYGSTAPEGWLICNGQSTAGYSDLAAIVGANVPNLQGRIPVGQDSGTFATIGATGGSESVALTSAQMPRHTHTDNGHVHSVGAHSHPVPNATHAHYVNHVHGLWDGSHAHYTWNDWRTAYGNNYNTGSSGDGRGNLTSYSGANVGVQWSNPLSDYQSHGISATSNSTAFDSGSGTASIKYTGGSGTTEVASNGDAHTNLQPYIVVNYIIKT